MAVHRSDERVGAAAPRLVITRPEHGLLELQLSGTWRISESVPDAALVRREIDAERPDRMVFDTREIVAWDSALVAFAARVVAIARTNTVIPDRTGLPAGVQRLVTLAEATPARAARIEKPPPSLLARIGSGALDRGGDVIKILDWIGELAVAFARLAIGHARLRRRDVALQMQLTGAQALGIVSLVVGLLGLILAFVGAVQLEKFGATLYVADLVGIAVVREMGAVMAAIVVAGRTGAAFAAELGTMRVTQEIDALTTLGISPTEFLVLPRVIAVTLMMPLLCIYADLVGVLGGAVVGIGVMQISPRVYIAETIGAVSLGDLFGGVFKATAYGFLIGVAACFEGMRSGNTAAGVGKAATSAVVDGIVLVIAACGLFAVVFYELGI
jgi:phospholipid/cholesterol/gamma-HCH transport system permease protein